MSTPTGHKQTAISVIVRDNRTSGRSGVEANNGPAGIAARSTSQSQRDWPLSRGVRSPTKIAYVSCQLAVPP
ncbi:hypothetical protein GCM10027072_60680 [Streptomyces bullii]